MNFHISRPVAQPPHRIPGLFDIAQVGRRRRRSELSELVESLSAPRRATAVPVSNAGAR